MTLWAVRRATAYNGRGRVLIRWLIPPTADVRGGVLLNRSTIAVVVSAILLASAMQAPSAVAHDAPDHRVNAGGGAVTGTPGWSADTVGAPSPHVNAAATGNKVLSTTNAIDLTHASVPAGTPQSIFKNERWDPPTAPEMQWDFAVTPGSYQVRLYFAEIHANTQAVGARVFDVSIEGAVVLNDYDVYQEVGGYRGVVKTFTVTADANLDIDFGHVVQNPKVNAIEIVPGSTPNQLGAAPSTVGFGQVVVGQSEVVPVQLTNLGAADDPSIVVDATTITGLNPNQFSDSFNDAANVTLAPGQSTTVNATFAPTSTGAKSATLGITHSGSNSPTSVLLSGSGVSTQVGTWQTLAPSGPNRQEVSYIQVGGRFYLAGGGTAHEVYDPSTNTWGTLAPLPESLDHIQAVEVGGIIYYIGGLEAWPQPASAQVYAYDPATNTFSQKAPMPRPRGAGGVAVHQGKIYYAGGLSNGTAVSWFDVFDPVTNTWTQLPNMPQARDHFHAAVVGGTFWVTGGRATAIGATITSTIAYDFSTGAWRSSGLAPIPTARGGFGAAVVGDEILVIGGEGGGQTFSTVEAYDTSANTWRTLAPMPTARHGIQAAVCNGGVYVAAGGKIEGGGSPSDAHEAFFLGPPAPCAGSAPPSEVLYRVNAGGGAVTGTPGWSADTVGAPSPHVNAAATGNKVLSTTNAIDLTHASVPAGTPQSIFKNERWDPPTAPEMQWDFAVTPGSYQVRLYFAEIHANTQAVGARVFDVSIEGAVVLNDYDVYQEVGGYRGVVKTFTVTADANLDIDFGHVVQNPKVNAIEIVPGSTPNQLGAAPSTVGFGQVVVGQSEVVPVQLTNLGAADDPSIVVDATTITGLNPNQFSDSFNDAANVTLAPGQSTTVNATFAPTSTGAKSATLGITHSGSNSPTSVLLSGTGVSTIPVGFGKSSLQGETSGSPTSLQFGPDGRLYVSQFNGVIKAYTVARNGPNSYAVTATQTINLIQSIPNHDDDGTTNTSVTTRLITGILVAGTSANPVIYVASSDPRIGGGGSGADLNLDTNSSMISRLSWNGSSWQKLDLVRGLPRSEENHAANGMQLDPATNTLYVAMGGNTNKGAPSNNFALLPEFALSAAILSIDLDAIGNTTYDLPTLNDENRAGNPDANDPFGGNDGKNQARLVPGGPVQVHAAGFRNPYDIVITEAGRMYTIDNGGNAGWGDVPVGEGPGGTCTNATNEPGTSDQDALHHVTGPGYYGGHPNPTRGNDGNTFNTSIPQSPVSTDNPVECDYRKSGGTESTALTVFASSTNGIAEYTASNFGGSLKGELIAAGYVKDEIYRIELNQAGTAVTANQVLFSSVVSGPLDLVTKGDSDPVAPGTIWVATQKSGEIFIFEPNDFGSGGPPCSGSDDPALDEDDDGYSNADEIDNGTDPCSAGDVPPDWDHDDLSNLNDPDDDNDGSPDTSDPFAIDPDDGMTTHIPVIHTWENDAPDAGGILDLGFTGLMTNGSSNYEALYDPDQMTAGGAAGVVTVDAVSEGDALGSSNSQQYGFQFGVNANPATTDAFTAHTRILAPFAGLTAQDFQSMGLVVGTGDQDDYVKIVTAANAGAGGVQTVKETNGTVTSTPVASVPMPGPGAVDLYLSVDPDAGTVQARYSVTSGGVTGAVIDLGGPQAVPASWFTGSSGLAVGIISTSRGAAPPFPATWDLLEVTPDDTSDPQVIAQDAFNRTVTNAWGAADVGGPWTVVAGAAANFDVNGSKGTVVTAAGSGQQIAHLGQVSARDVDAQVAITFPNAPTGSASPFAFLLVRRQGTGAYYRVGLYVTSGGKVFIRGQTSANANLFADVDTGLSFSAGDTFVLRVQATGASPTTIRARAWGSGTAEPSSWQVTTTSSTAGLQTTGSVGIRTVVTGTLTTTLAFDGFLVEA